jgi:hypothetical protein
MTDLTITMGVSIIMEVDTRMGITTIKDADTMEVTTITMVTDTIMADVIEQSADNTDTIKHVESMKEDITVEPL